MTSPAACQSNISVVLTKRSGSWTTSAVNALNSGGWAVQVEDALDRIVAQEANVEQLVGAVEQPVVETEPERVRRGAGDRRTPPTITST